MIVEFILGPPGICLLAFALGLVVVARAVLKASDSGSQLSKLIAQLDREIQEAQEAIPETESRLARLKEAAPGLKKQYAAFDKYLGELLKLDTTVREDEKDDHERRQAMGTHKVDR